MIRMTTNNETKVLHYIMLTQMKGLGSVSQNALLNALGDAGRCFENDTCGDVGRCSGNKASGIIEMCFGMEADELLIPDRIWRIGKSRIEAFVQQRASNDIRHRAEEILDSSLASKVCVITREDKSFPTRFQGIDDMPIVLYCKGSFGLMAIPGL